MKIIIFGATGFLGFHVTRNLIESYPKAQLLIVHRSSSDLSALKNLKGNLLWLESSFDNFDSLNSTDIIYNMVGDTDLSPLHHKRQFEINVTLAKKVAQLAARLNAKLIHTSSISAFGFHNEIIDETFNSTAMDSGVNYSRTKYLGEQAVRAVANVRVVFINPAAIIGSHDKNNWSQLVGMIKAQTLPGIPPGSGSYCHVSEVARAHVQAIELGVEGENYILAGKETSFVEVVQTICDILNVENNNKVLPGFILRLLGRFNDFKTKFTGVEQDLSYEKSLLITKRTCASSEKAKKVLGYRDDIPLEQMFRECIEWMEQQ